MRRLGLVLAAVLGVTAIAGAPVAARAPSPTPSAPPGAAGPGSGQPVCTVSDSKLAELSGLVAIDNGYLTINDSAEDAAAKRLWRLDGQCKQVGSYQYPTESRDPEDLGVGPDGSFWVADIGDNDARRQTIAVWKLAPNAKTLVPYRATYPDGAHDAEAILIGADGVPIVVTKELSRAGI